MKIQNFIALKYGITLTFLIIPLEKLVSIPIICTFEIDKNGFLFVAQFFIRTRNSNIFIYYLAQGCNADVMQPGLLSLQPSIEEIMASLGEPNLFLILSIIYSIICYSYQQKHLQYDYSALSYRAVEKRRISWIIQR